ncbi:hypothetical protein, partial [Marinimicrobium sp. ABcell2]|uniref:hypothetical protein n=1 Tax=Marinimicrobium sp. ABcell2 TaxID=3069751 RepID=UPI0027B16C87
KSLPSADSLSAILDAYSVDISVILEGVNLSLVDRQFLHIPAVASHIANNQKMHTSSIKRWLFSSAIACIVGFTAIAAGHLGLVFANTQYSYYSAGIVNPGESQLIFDNWRQHMQRHTFGTEDFRKHVRETEEKKQEMVQRLDENYLLANEYKGEVFVLPVEGGSRTYKLMQQTHEGKEVLRGENRLLMLVGFFLAIGGLIGFIVEYRLRRANSS